MLLCRVASQDIFSFCVFVEILMKVADPSKRSVFGVAKQVNARVCLKYLCVSTCWRRIAGCVEQRENGKGTRKGSLAKIRVLLFSPVRHVWLFFRSAHSAGPSYFFLCVANGFYFGTVEDFWEFSEVFGASPHRSLQGVFQTICASV